MHLPPNTVAVLGGAGPLVSSRFIEVVYRLAPSYRKEQELPTILLYSDPSIPDRTEWLLQGKDQELLDEFESRLQTLYPSQIKKIIVSCITLHALFPQLSSHYHSKLLSLVEIILQKVIAHKKPALLLCTEGTRQMQIFPSHPLWQKAHKWIYFLDNEDQQRVHSWIYQIKNNQWQQQQVHEQLQELLVKYQCNFLIAGCTEFHLLSTAQLEKAPEETLPFIDPLLIIARHWKEFTQ